MKYLYYAELLNTVTILDAPSEEHGELIGTLEHLPANIRFLAASLLANAGFTHVTALSIKHGLD